MDNIIVADIPRGRFTINRAPEPREKAPAKERRRCLPDIAPHFKERALRNQIDVRGAAA